MEALAERQILEQEQRIEAGQSFDVLASVNMLRFDLENYGKVLPETLSQVYDEELTYIAEGIDLHSYTPFKLREENGELASFYQGKWEPYTLRLIKGLITAEKEAADDPRKTFLAERAAEDLRMGYKMRALEVGESMVWHSPFPEEEYKLYGEEFIGDQGFQARRRMGFIYRAERQEDGGVLLESQTVDNSDDEAFAAALELYENDKNASLATVVEAYDYELGQEHEAEFRNGRKVEAGKIDENAWEFIQKNKLVLDCYFEDLVDLAKQDISDNELKIAKKRLTYGTWAQLKKRLSGSMPIVVSNHNPVEPTGFYITPEFIRAERQQAYKELSKRGEVMFGCGGSISGDKALLDATEADVFDLAFNGKEDDSKTDSTMRCVNCPKCRTFHDEVKPVQGKYRCKKKDCGYEASA